MFSDAPVARVVKLVDAGDSKSPAARRAGSIPFTRSTLTFQGLPSNAKERQALPRKRGNGIHHTRCITPSQPHRAKTLSR